MHLVSNFGDIAVLFPASLGLIAFLVRFGLRSDAAAYAAALALCLTMALSAKLAFAACGAGHSAFGVGSPSGHAAFGATFYGCLAVLFASGRTMRRRLALYGAAIALIALIGASRVAMGAHTGPEVGAGLLIGAASIALFRALRVGPGRVELSSRALGAMSGVAALYALCLLLLADRFTAEPVIDAIAARIGAALRLCG